MPWKQIRNLPGCEVISPPGIKSEFILLKSDAQTNWLVGEYNELTKFASALRQNHLFRDFLVANQVRLGFRKTDIAPKGERQKSYGKMIKGKHCETDFKAKRKVELGRRVKMDEAPPDNRITDIYLNIKTFWESQTPQSHHVVEFNHLETLQVSCRKGKSSMDYLQLPAVLLAAEFHQRHVSSHLKPTHRWGSKKLEAQIHETYSQIYLSNHKLFKPLWLIAKAILEKADVNS